MFLITVLRKESRKEGGRIATALIAGNSIQAALRTSFPPKTRLKDVEWDALRVSVSILSEWVSKALSSEKATSGGTFSLSSEGALVISLSIHQGSHISGVI